jgi:transcriptional regulator with XRE-family HTH domain
MIGLTLARELYRLTLEELATRIDVTKQSISLWEKDGKIPEKRLKDLSRVLCIPENYLLKELSELDKLKIEKIVLENKLEDSVVIVDEPIFDEKGNIISKNQKCYQSDIIETIEDINKKIGKLQLIEEIQNTVEKSEINEYALKSLIEILDNKRVNKAVIVQILKAIKLAQSNENTEDNDVNQMIRIIKVLENKQKNKMKDALNGRKLLDGYQEEK